MRVTDNIRRLLRDRLGLVVLKANHPGIRFLDVPPAAPFVFALHQAFPSLSGRTFLQVGSNDGQRNDPLVPFVRRFEWRGTLVEPRQEFAEVLRSRYAGSGNVTVVQAAVADEQGEAELYFIDPNLPGLPDWAGGLGTLDRSRIRQACTELALPEHAVRTERIRCLTWATLPAEPPPETVEILVIDTEGHDLPLLESWPWERARPRVIHFEHACAAPERHFRMIGRLQELRYECVIGAVDTSAYLPRS